MEGEELEKKKKPRAELWLFLMAAKGQKSFLSLFEEKKK